MGGFNLAWGRGWPGVAVGSRGVVGSHGWPWVLLLVGVFGLLEFQRCFNGVFGWME